MGCWSVAEAMGRGVGAVGVASGWPWKALPYSLRGVQESFSPSGDAGVGFWITLVVFLTGVVLLLVGSYRRNLRSRRLAMREDTPERLFAELLDALKLEPQEKHLLGGLTRRGRLSHPVMCLLSPGLLAWTERLAQAERPVRNRHEQARISRTLDSISIKLYDHAPPRGQKTPTIRRGGSKTPIERREPQGVAMRLTVAARGARYDK